MTPDQALVDIAGELYALPLERFTAERDRRAKDAEDRTLAAAVKKLRKPTVAAWAVNRLVREESDQLDQAFALAASLREAAASMDGEELRTLTRQRRQLTHALAASARRVARAEGTTLTASTVDQVEQMLNAAMLDDVAATALRTGLVITGFHSTGLGDLDPDSVLAVPGVSGVRAAPLAPAPVTLRAVPDDDRVRRARREDAVARAEEAHDSARRRRDEAVTEAEDLDARRLAVQDEIDQVRRRLAQLDDDADEIEAEAEGVEEERQESEAELADATQALDRARAALADFDAR